MSKKNRNYTGKKIMKKSVALIIVVAAILVTGLVGFLSNGFTNGDVQSWIKERNPDNLLVYTMGVDEYVKGDGTIVSVADDGTIKVTGEIAEGVNDWSYNLGEVKLSAGTYVLTCSKNCSKTNYIIAGTYTDASGAQKTVYSDITGENSITLTKETTIDFSLLIFKDGAINITARPVLNSGSNPIDYYVKRTIGD